MPTAYTLTPAAVQTLGEVAPKERDAPEEEEGLAEMNADKRDRRGKKQEAGVGLPFGDSSLMANP
jgi:hypothetical protein